MAKIRKINVSEIEGRDPFDSDATLPNGTLVLYRDGDTNRWKLRLHDGVTNGGEPFGDTGDVRFIDGKIYNKNASQGVQISPGGESTVSYVFVPNNTQSDAVAVELINRSETGKIKIGVSDKDWDFGADGSLTFPDFSVQTTAWTKRIVDVPASSLGAVGDKEGDLAFNSTHQYYCTADYTGTPTTVSWTNVLEVGEAGEIPHHVQADITDPSQLNGILTITNVIVNGAPASTETVTSFELVSGNTYRFFLFNTSEPWNILQTTTLQVVPNIWRRVAWSNDTW
jgi:hypothetical protein